MKIGRKWIVLGSIAVVVIVIGVIGATQIRFGNDSKDEEDKQEVVRRGEFLVKVQESGRLRSLVEVDVRSNVEGEILDIFVEESELVEEGAPLLKIDDEQIIEDMNQARAYRDARKAEFDQSELRIQIAEKRETSDLLQARNAVAKAKASLVSFAANKLQRITEAETLVATTQNLLNRDKISLRQDEISLTQAKLTLDRANVNVQSAKVTLETTQAEHKRNQELYKKELISEQALELSQKQLVLNTSQYETAKKEVESQKETIKSREENINAMKQAILSREATLNLNRKNVQTVKESQEAQEKQLNADLENAQSRLKQTEETTEEEKDLTKHSKVSAAANLLQAESRLKSQEERLSWTTVVAPMSGTITRISVEEGEIITSGRSAFSRGEAIMRIADLTKMIVITQINQVEIGKIEEDQRVEIRVDSYRNKVFNGRVSEISPSSTQRPQGGSVITFEVEIEVDIPEEEYQLLPGMSADVDIIVFEEKDILQIPIAAVLSPEVFTVRATLNPDVLGQFQQGQRLKVQSLIGDQFDGQVSNISPSETRGNLEILFDEPPKGLRPGPTEIVIVISDNNRLANIEAEIRSERQHFVKLDTGEPSKKKDGEKGVKTHIKVGKRNKTHFEVVQGLKDGDRVFVPSMMELTKGESNKSK